MRNAILVGVLALGLAVGAAASSANAASLLTSASGYSGPTLDLSAYAADSSYVRTAGPVTLPQGITYTSSIDRSVLGHGGYGLNQNGSSVNTNIIGTNDGSAIVTLTFASPVASFGAGFNYAAGPANSFPMGTTDPTIAAYDSSNDLIASYDLATTAPISTRGLIDAYDFRGISGDGALIKYFRFSGSFIIAAASPDIGHSPIPEPGTWVLMLSGLGCLGAALRSTRRWESRRLGRTKATGHRSSKPR